MRPLGNDVKSARPRKVGANALVPDWFATNVVEMEVHSCQWE